MSSLIPNVRVQNWYNGDPPYGLRGYLDDRVNRIIGYAMVRQVREKVGNCHSPKLMRDYVDSCTGDMKIPIFDEDDKYEYVSSDDHLIILAIGPTVWAGYHL